MTVPAGHGYGFGPSGQPSGTQPTLLCSDLFVRRGNALALTKSDVVEPTPATLVAFQTRCWPR